MDKDLRKLILAAYAVGASRHIESEDSEKAITSLQDAFVGMEWSGAPEPSDVSNAIYYSVKAIVGDSHQLGETYPDEEETENVFMSELFGTLD